MLCGDVCCALRARGMPFGSLNGILIFLASDRLFRVDPPDPERRLPKQNRHLPKAARTIQIKAIFA